MTSEPMVNRLKRANTNVSPRLPGVTTPSAPWRSHYRAGLVGIGDFTADVLVTPFTVKMGAVPR